jgi:tRNA-splicing ligase RtcB
MKDTRTPSGIELLSPEGGKPVKMWTQGVPVELEAKEQLEKLAQLPFVFHHVAVMPDVHVGKGSTIGSVIPTLGAVIPAAVGVDIGCGMMAAKTSLRASDLPDNLSGLRSAIEQAVPHGMSPKTRNHKGRDVGSWNNPPPPVDAGWAKLKDEFDAICRKYPKLRGTNNHKHLGTLGSGNHFVEVCLAPHGQPARPGPGLPRGRHRALRRLRGGGRLGPEVRAHQPRGDDAQRDPRDARGDPPALRDARGGS